MKVETETQIEQIRTASRQLVRELGFMEQTLAGTDLSPSAVHALIEIAEGRATTARALSQILHLEKSSVSRLLQKLIKTGEVAEHQDEEDSRLKRLRLTPKGRQLFCDISEAARKRVGQAIAPLPSEAVSTLVAGLEGYAAALATSRSDDATAYRPPETQIASGYRPTLLACVVGMHARYYNSLVGFGLPFETKVASELAAFLTRLDAPTNRIWHASSGGAISASIAIDGEDLGDGIAHLRWFIVDDALRGTGVGKKLLDSAIAFCDEQRFAQTHLWTFQGLDAARGLYEQAGFRLIEENPGEQWGGKVIEQKFMRPKDAGRSKGGSR